jgi:ankyrin repeat protein
VIKTFSLSGVFMHQPDLLTKHEPLLWSTGTGVDVWAMFCAAIDGDLATVQRLLSKDPSLARCQYAYRTPLYFAVRENRIEVAEYLLDHGADPLGLAVNDSLLEITRDRGYTALGEMLESKLAVKFNASAKGKTTALAIRNRDHQRLRSLLDAEPELLHAGDLRGNQPIHWATMTRQLDFIDELLSRGVEINAGRPDGARPIQLTNGDYHFRGWRDVPSDHPTSPRAVLDYLRARGAYCDISTAAYIGDVDRVRELLDQDPTLANRPSEYITYYACAGTPLKNAASGGHLEIVRLLLEHGADPNLPEEGIAPRGGALYAAVYNKHLEIARVLLEAGANPNAPVESSADALSIAILHDNEPMVELLCSYGASRSVELLCHYGDLRTAAAVFAADPKRANDPDGLAGAAGNGHEALVRLILRYQADLPKRIAIAGKTRETTEVLFEHGMNPSQPDWLGITPLHEFARRGDLQNAAIFLDHGADLHARDDDICSTPLGWAAKFGRTAMMEFLLQRGAKPMLTDDPPWATPLAWATRRGHTQIATLLRKAMS